MQEEKEYVFQPQINKRFVKKPLIKSSNDLYIIEFDDYMKQIQDGVVKLKTNKLPMENIEEGKRFFKILLFWNNNSEEFFIAKISNNSAAVFDRYKIISLRQGKNLFCNEYLNI